MRGAAGGRQGDCCHWGEGQAVARGERRLLRGAEGGRRHCPVCAVLWSLKAEAAVRGAMR